uniref:SH2 domain-containing protein n=1 Tax=Macrostomum lignano TaxID=282301 RepID=A0A1I8FF09_9PLAT
VSMAQVSSEQLELEAIRTAAMPPVLTVAPPEVRSWTPSSIEKAGQYRSAGHQRPGTKLNVSDFEADPISPCTWATSTNRWRQLEPSGAGSVLGSTIRCLRTWTAAGRRNQLQSAPSNCEVSSDSVAFKPESNYRQPRHQLAQCDQKNPERREEALAKWTAQHTSADPAKLHDKRDERGRTRSQLMQQSDKKWIDIELPGILDRPKVLKKSELPVDEVAKRIVAHRLTTASMDDSDDLDFQRRRDLPAVITDASALRTLSTEPHFYSDSREPCTGVCGAALCPCRAGVAKLCWFSRSRRFTRICSSAPGDQSSDFEATITSSSSGGASDRSDARGNHQKILASCPTGSEYYKGLVSMLQQDKHLLIPKNNGPTDKNALQPAREEPATIGHWLRLGSLPEPQKPAVA